MMCMYIIFIVFLSLAIASLILFVIAMWQYDKGVEEIDNDFHDWLDF